MSGGGRRVLVVDDDALIRLLVGFTLTGQDWVVLEAATCAEGVAALTAEPFDVVVLDESLPDGSGLDVVPDVPAGVHVVLYSGAATVVRPPGVHAVISKGGPPEALVDHLATI